MSKQIQKPYVVEGKTVPHLLAKDIADKEHIFYHTTYFYRYNADKKVYQKLGNKVATANFKNEIKEMFVKPSEVSVAKVTEVLKNLEDYCIVDDVNDYKKHIAFKNGVWNIDKKIIEPHNPKYRLTKSYNATIEPNRDYASDFAKSKFGKFLLDIVDKDDIPTIQQMIGLCLSPRGKEVQKAFFLLGEGSNGKSALCEIIQALCNKETTAIDLSKLSQRFATANLLGNYVNINPDNSNVGLENTENIKKIINAEPIFMERKGVDGDYHEIDMTFVLGLNELPNTNDKSFGFFRRMIIIPFDVATFGTQDEIREGKANKLKNPQLIKDIIANELDIVAWFGLQGLYKVINNNYSIHESSKAKKVWKNYRNESDTISAYIDEFVEITNNPVDNELTIRELYEDYVKYVEDVYGDGRVRKLNQFTKALEHLLSDEQIEKKKSHRLKSLGNKVAMTSKLLGVKLSYERMLVPLGETAQNPFA